MQINIRKLLNSRTLYYITIAIVVILLSYSILPMVILRDNYVFTVWDNLDSNVGIIQVVHDNGLFLSLDDNLPIMNNINGVYTTISYNIYNILWCIFGYLNGEIINHTLSVVLAFFSMQSLLKYIFKKSDVTELCIIYLISVAYAITPCAPNRLSSFAILPLIIRFFIVLQKKVNFSPMSLLAVIFPLFLNFAAFTVFICIFWFLFLIVDLIKTKKININLIIALCLITIATIIVNINYFKLLLFAEKTSRSLKTSQEFSFNLENLYKYLKYGQKHAYSLHFTYLFPICVIGTLYMFYIKKINGKYFDVIIFGWVLWILTSILAEFNDAGIKTGLIIIDGFNWGRIIYFMRFIWYIMLACILLVNDENVFIKLSAYIFLIFQLYLIVTSDTTFNDNRNTIVRAAFNVKSDETITFKEFFSEELLNEIKKDINYKNEVVVAYGFHPSILQYNGFNTLDGYLTVHSSEYQESFRKVISPALEKYKKYRDYYDGWGGRSYIFGELDYDPDINKDVDPATLYIDVDAYKEFDGKYIISRAEISNSKELGLILINDYTSDDSIYHFYVYSV